MASRLVGDCLDAGNGCRVEARGAALSASEVRSGVDTVHGWHKPAEGDVLHLDLSLC